MINFQPCLDDFYQFFIKKKKKIPFHFRSLWREGEKWFFSLSIAGILIRPSFFQGSSGFRSIKEITSFRCTYTHAHTWCRCTASRGEARSMESGIIADVDRLKESRRGDPLPYLCNERSPCVSCLRPSTQRPSSLSLSLSLLHPYPPQHGSSRFLL